jgi:hypothetical protein
MRQAFVEGAVAFRVDTAILLNPESTHAGESS